MNDTQKMLQAIIHGQNALKQELLSKIDKLDKRLGERLGGRIDCLERRIDDFKKNLTKKIDNVDKQLAYFLRKRADRIKQKSIHFI